MSHWKMTQLCLYTFTAHLESNEIQSFFFFFFFFLPVTICSNLSAFFCQSYQSHHLSQPEILLIIIPSSLAQSIIESVWTSRNVCCISGSLTGTWNLLRSGAMGNRQGCRMQSVEVAEQEWSVSLCRVKTWP